MLRPNRPQRTTTSKSSNTRKAWVPRPKNEGGPRTVALAAAGKLQGHEHKRRCTIKETILNNYPTHIFRLHAGRVWNRSATISGVCPLRSPLRSRRNVYPKAFGWGLWCPHIAASRVCHSDVVRALCIWACVGSSAKAHNAYYLVYLV